MNVNNLAHDSSGKINQEFLDILENLDKVGYLTVIL